MHVPGHIVAAPSTPYDAKGMPKSAFRNPTRSCSSSTSSFTSCRGRYRRRSTRCRLGLPQCGARGRMSPSSPPPRWCEGRCRRRGGGGGKAVIDPRTLAPLDVQTIAESMRKTGRLVVPHEARKFAGFGGEIVAAVTERASDALRAPPQRIGAPSTPVPYNSGLESRWTRRPWRSSRLRTGSSCSSSSRSNRRYGPETPSPRSTRWDSSRLMAETAIVTGGMMDNPHDDWGRPIYPVVE